MWHLAESEKLFEKWVNVFSSEALLQWNRCAKTSKIKFKNRRDRDEHRSIETAKFFQNVIKTFKIMNKLIESFVKIWVLLQNIDKFYISARKMIEIVKNIAWKIKILKYYQKSGSKCSSKSRKEYLLLKIWQDWTETTLKSF